MLARRVAPRQTAHRDRGQASHDAAAGGSELPPLKGDRPLRHQAAEPTLRPRPRQSGSANPETDQVIVIVIIIGGGGGGGVDVE